MFQCVQISNIKKDVRIFMKILFLLHTEVSIKITLNHNKNRSFRISLGYPKSLGYFSLT